jgi:hypothetical protein
MPTWSKRRMCRHEVRPPGSAGGVSRACRGPSAGERSRPALLVMKSPVQLLNRSAEGTVSEAAARRRRRRALRRLTCPVSPAGGLGGGAIRDTHKDTRATQSRSATSAPPPSVQDGQARNRTASACHDWSWWPAPVHPNCWRRSAGPRPPPQPHPPIAARDSRSAPVRNARGSRRRRSTGYFRSGGHDRAH